MRGAYLTTLIVGCGYVGSALAGRLVDAGAEVLCARRRASDLPGGAIGVELDVRDAASLEALRAHAERVEAVVFAASPGARDEAAYRSLYVEGLRALLDRLTRFGAPLARAIVTTSTAVYGQTSGEWVDERSPTEPPSFSGRALLEAEAVLERAPYATCSLRLGGIYGPGRTSLVDRVRAGTLSLPPEPRYGNRIHRDDCAGLLAHLLSVEALPPVLIGVDDAPAPLLETARWLADQLGVAPPRVDADAALGPRRSASNKRCRNTRMHETGYSLQYPTYREGYRALLVAS